MPHPCATRGRDRRPALRAGGGSAGLIAHGAVVCSPRLERQTQLLRDPGASEHAFPLYTVRHTQALRTRLLSVLEGAADANPARIGEGALNFVIVGAGPTGVRRPERWLTLSTR